MLPTTAGVCAATTAPYLVGFTDKIVAASGLILGILEEGSRGRVLEIELDLALVLPCTLFEFININVGFGNALQLFRSEPYTTHLVVVVVLGLETQAAELELLLLEVVTLGTGWEKKALGDILGVFLVQNGGRLGVEVSRGSAVVYSLDALKNVVAHSQLNIQLSYLAVSLERGIANSGIGVDVLQKADSVVFTDRLVVMGKHGLHGVFKGGCLGSGGGDDLVNGSSLRSHDLINRGAHLLGSIAEYRWPLGRVGELFGSHGAGEALSEGYLGYQGCLAQLLGQETEAEDGAWGSQCDGEEEDEARDEEQTSRL